MATNQKACNGWERSHVYAARSNISVYPYTIIGQKEKENELCIGNETSGVGT
jgi:hypothetical protein